MQKVENCQKYETDPCENGIDDSIRQMTHNEPSWVKLRSITQERALDEFLSTAELAGTEFTAGTENTRITKLTFRA